MTSFEETLYMHELLKMMKYTRKPFVALILATTTTRPPFWGQGTVHHTQVCAPRGR